MNRTATTTLGSLAALAVMTMAAAGPATAAPAGPATAAEDVLCGTPAEDAVLETVHHDAEFETVEHPAVFETVDVSHSEWLWTRTVRVPEYKYQRSVAVTLVEWKRDAGVVELEWIRQVLETPGTPAVEERREVQTVTIPAVLGQYIYEQHQTGNRRYEDSPTWNAQVVGEGQDDKKDNGQGDGQDNDRPDRGLGWTLVGQEVLEAERTEQVSVVVQEARDAVEPTYDTTTTWATERPAGPGWVETDAQRTAVISGVEQQLLPEGEEPEGEDWYETGATFEGRTYTQNGWFEVDPEEDWVATGQDRPGRAVTETTIEHSATAPDGWRKVAGSEMTVVTGEEQVLVEKAWTDKKQVKGPWTEQVKVKDAVPAGPDCVLEEQPPVVTPPVVVVEPPVVLTPPAVVVPPVENPVITPEVETPPAPIVLGEEDVIEDEKSTDDKRKRADDRTETTPAVLGVEATTTTVTATSTPSGAVAVPTSVDAGLSTALATPAQGSDWRQAAGLFALAAGVALYVVPMRRRAEVR